MPQQPSNETPDITIIEQVYTHARQIPVGHVIAYGALGARCTPPISGYVCGRIMNQAQSDVPWWRVVAKDGSLPIAKRNPLLANEQRQRLAEEGIRFDESGKILMQQFAIE
jgi:alkylated DNA nucleotide flippase Atl1